MDGSVLEVTFMAQIVEPNDLMENLQILIRLLELQCVEMELEYLMRNEMTVMMMITMVEVDFVK